MPPSAATGGSCVGEDSGTAGWQPRCCLAPVDSIAAPLCVIPDVGPNKTRYFSLLPRQKWSEQFVAWLEQDPELDNQQFREDDPENP